MKGSHWVLYRMEPDPRTAKIVVVGHEGGTPGEAANGALHNAAEIEARQWNAARQRAFDEGNDCGRRRTAEDYKHRYFIWSEDDQ